MRRFTYDLNSKFAMMENLFIRRSRCKTAAIKIVVTREGLFLSGLMVDFPVLRSQWKSHNEDKRDSSVI